MKFFVALSLLFAGLSAAAVAPVADAADASCSSGCAGVCGSNGFCITTSGSSSYNFPCGSGSAANRNQCSGRAGQACTAYGNKATQCPA